MARVVFACFWFFFYHLSFGQLHKISGVIFDEAGKTIAFCSLGIQGEDVGTVSGVNGHFQLEVPPELTSDSITFSHIGYKSQRMAIADFIGVTEVTMVEEVTNLQEVIIQGKKGKIIEFGYEKETDTYLWIKGTKNGSEIATFLPLKRRIILNNISLQIQNKEGEKFQLLLGIYEMNHAGKPGKQLLQNNILIESKQKGGWLRVDVSDQNLTINKPFFVGFKWIDISNRLPKVGVNFKAEKSFVRVAPMGDWHTYLNCNVKAEGTLLKSLKVGY